MGNAEESSNSTKREFAEILKEKNTANSTQREDITIQVEHAQNKVVASLVNFFEEDYESITLIPRVPEILRQGANGAYDPQIMSIGPYHWGKPQFEDMEKQKRRFLLKFLHRNLECRFEDYIKEVESLEEQLRRYYYKDICMISRENFVEMMLVDGCFLIEFFLQVQEGTLGFKGHNAETYMFYEVANDILKLENQLPFFLLKRIYDIFATQENMACPSSFIEAALAFSCSRNNWDPKDFSTENKLQHYLTETIHHFLHLHHLFLVSQSSGGEPMFQTPPESSSSTMGRMCMRLFNLVAFNASTCSKDPLSLWKIPCATQLHELGVKFKIIESGESMVKFDHGVMEITPIFLNDIKIALLQNLIAFEILYMKTDPYFSSFFKFIDLLVNTSNDVALLRRYGIIEHEIRSDEELALLFNQLTKGILYSRSKLADQLCNKVNEYCNIKWHRWRASFIRDFCSSPWKTIALVAAAILLVLTFIQSYMSLHSYFRPPRS